MARLVSLSILTSLIVFLGITFFHVIAPFLLPLFLAAVMTVIFRPLFHYFLLRTKQRVRVAAGLTTATIMTMLLLPLLVGISIGSLQLYTLTQETLGGDQLDVAVRRVRSELQAEIGRRKESLFILLQPMIPTDPEITDPDKQLQSQREYFDLKLVLIQGNVRNQLNSVAARSLGIAGDKTFNILGAAIALLIGLVMFMIALYYFFADGPALLQAGEGLIPVHAIYQRQLLRHFEKVIRAVVLATFLAALGQGLATALALTLVGFNHFFIFFLVATLASMIPLTGTWLVWGPCAIWLAKNGQWGSAVFLTLFGSIGIGTLDNVIKTYVLQSDAKLHPLLAFVSILGGLNVMGLWGVFVGPIVACCLHALIRIFNTELKEFAKERYSDFPDRREFDTPTWAQEKTQRGGRTAVGTADSTEDGKQAKSGKNDSRLKPEETAPSSDASTAPVFDRDSNDSSSDH